MYRYSSRARRGTARRPRPCNDHMLDGPGSRPSDVDVDVDISYIPRCPWDSTLPYPPPSSTAASGSSPPPNTNIAPCIPSTDMGFARHTGTDQETESTTTPVVRAVMRKRPIHIQHGPLSDQSVLQTKAKARRSHHFRIHEDRITVDVCQPKKSQDITSDPASYATAGL